MNTNPTPINGVDDEKLSCLNSWPENTVGYKQEEILIKQLNAFCKEHGYGRVPQICNLIREIWYDESKVEIYEKERKKRLEFMEECRKSMEGEGL